MTESEEYFKLAQTSLIYSIDELNKHDVENFLRLIRTKRNSGWTPEMIEVHLIANISDRIKRQYPKLRKHERQGIAEEMVQAMLERILREGIDVQ